MVIWERREGVVCWRQRSKACVGRDRKEGKVHQDHHARRAGDSEAETVGGNGLQTSAFIFSAAAAAGKYCLSYSCCHFRRRRRRYHETRKQSSVPRAASYRTSSCLVQSSIAWFLLCLPSLQTHFQSNSKDEGFGAPSPPAPTSFFLHRARFPANHKVIVLVMQNHIRL